MIKFYLLFKLKCQFRDCLTTIHNALCSTLKAGTKLEMVQNSSTRDKRLCKKNIIAPWRLKIKTHDENLSYKIKPKSL